VRITFEYAVTNPLLEELRERRVFVMSRLGINPLRRTENGYGT
jgi:hypothetical protein